MDILGGGEKGIDPCLHQELIYIEFWQHMKSLMLVKITKFINTRF